MCRTIRYHNVSVHTVTYRTVSYRTIPYHTIPYCTVPCRTCSLIQPLTSSCCRPSLAVFSTCKQIAKNVPIFTLSAVYHNPHSGTQVDAKKKKNRFGRRGIRFAPPIAPSSNYSRSALRETLYNASTTENVK